MTRYTTVLEVWGPSHDTTNFTSGGGHEEIPGASTKHAVADPGTDEVLKTLCGKPAGRMRRGLSEDQRVEWASTERISGVCRNCQKAAAERS
ncbi:hypothetical protein [Nocardia sp. NPDC060249]|uniref:hypothetical protein n=1 Tax=Nocardia sp. NPDC060249 TaxID=3347082 RepID=UPI0036614182